MKAPKTIYVLVLLLVLLLLLHMIGSAFPSLSVSPTPDGLQKAVYIWHRIALHRIASTAQPTPPHLPPSTAIQRLMVVVIHHRHHDVITAITVITVPPSHLLPLKVDGKLSQKVVLAAKECASVKHFVLVTALGTGKV